MAKRKFIYRKGGPVEVTPESDRALCDEVHADAASRSLPLEFGTPGGRRSRNASVWPRVSDTMAINPEQISQELAILRKHGVSCDYEIVRDDDGTPNTARPIFTDQKHKNRYQEALNYADADAGYSGVAPKNFTFDDYKRAIRR